MQVTPAPSAEKWRWTKTGEDTVVYEEAVRRCRTKMGAFKHHTFSASQVGSIVWPKNRMRAQGLALAVGKFLKRMQKDGYIRYRTSMHDRYEERGYIWNE